MIVTGLNCSNPHSLMIPTGYRANAIHYVKPDTAIHTKHSFLAACGFSTGQLQFTR